MFIVSVLIGTLTLRMQIRNVFNAKAAETFSGAHNIHFTYFITVLMNRMKNLNPIINRYIV